MDLLNLGLLGVPFSPRPEERTFLQRTLSQRNSDLTITLAVLDDRESDRFFGVSLSRRGIQPLWLHIENHSSQLYRLRLASIDPNYYTPLEAAMVNHYRIMTRILRFGVLAWFFLPILILLPLRILAAWTANLRMNAYFQEHGIGSGLIRPGSELIGFVFTSHDAGSKQVAIQLLGGEGVKEFSFSIPIPGLRVDHGTKRFDELSKPCETIECDEAELRQRLAAMPATTTNRRGTVHGDPLNLVVVGELDTLIDGFGGRWDETEVISLASCWRTAKAFLLGLRYRYSPVSSLYYAGRCQDVAFQRARETINERLHLRLWITPLRFEGKPVWIGQISRDIGVRFTFKTWNLTTHKIDPNVDESRDYVIDDLMEAGRVSRVAFIDGVGAAERTAPRRNLTGDPYYTDGYRAVAIFSETRTKPVLLNWS